MFNDRKLGHLAHLANNPSVEATVFKFQKGRNLSLPGSGYAVPLSERALSEPVPPKGQITGESLRKPVETVAHQQLWRTPYGIISPHKGAVEGATMLPDTTKGLDRAMTTVHTRNQTHVVDAKTGGVFHNTEHPMVAPTPSVLEANRQFLANVDDRHFHPGQNVKTYRVD